MPAKTANLYARIEPDVKNQAEGILSALGVPVSNAINMFYKQIILHRGLPFKVQLPASSLPEIEKMSASELDAELEKGFQDMENNRIQTADTAFSDFWKDHLK